MKLLALIIGTAVYTSNAITFAYKSPLPVHSQEDDANIVAPIDKVEESSRGQEFGRI